MLTNVCQKIFFTVHTEFAMAIKFVKVTFWFYRKQGFTSTLHLKFSKQVHCNFYMAVTFFLAGTVFNSLPNMAKNFIWPFLNFPNITDNFTRHFQNMTNNFFPALFQRRLTTLFSTFPNTCTKCITDNFIQHFSKDDSKYYSALLYTTVTIIENVSCY